MKDVSQKTDTPEEQCRTRNHAQRRAWHAVLQDVFPSVLMTYSGGRRAVAAVSMPGLLSEPALRDASPTGLRAKPSTKHEARSTKNLECGSGLIIVIWVIGMMSLLVVSFAFEAHLETKVLSFSRKQPQAEALAMSGMAIAEMLMEKQASGQVTGNESPESVADDRWYAPAVQLKRGRPVAGLVEPLGDGYIRLDIEPEPGRRNVNKLTDDDWERVLAVGGVPPELWPSLIDCFDDWIGPELPPRKNGAQTEDYYATLTPPYRARNAPIDTVRELLLVKNFNETILSGGVLNPNDPPEKQIVLSGIQDMLTTYGDGKVNVNAAGLRVLMTLPGVDSLVAHAIMEERERVSTDQAAAGADAVPDSSFKTVADMMGRIPGLDASVQNYATTVSSVFRVTSVGQVGRVTRRIWAIVQWDSGRKKFKILQWREEG